jgi:hypothetical protein
MRWEKIVAIEIGAGIIMILQMQCRSEDEDGVDDCL